MALSKKPVTGMKDIMPAEMQLRDYVIGVIKETYEAVERALYGEDISQGALYFCARSKVDSTKMQWFDQKLTRLFAYGNHEFFL